MAEPLITEPRAPPTPIELIKMEVETQDKQNIKQAEANEPLKLVGLDNTT